MLAVDPARFTIGVRTGKLESVKVHAAAGAQ